MLTKKKILVIDDTRTNIEILLELLADKYDVMVALDGNIALEIAHDNGPDLILLDIMMPEMDGYQVCQKLKENNLTKGIPIIFITAKMDEDSIDKAYQMGGIDYVTKPFKPRELLARVKTHLYIQDIISDLQSSKEELKLLADTDPLTKLYNRRYFSNTSENIFNLAQRNSLNLSTIMLDIDKFKRFNDTYGHKVGDLVIIKLASILQQLTRKSDIVCRFGGEEFIILLPDTEKQGGIIIAEKIRAHVENSPLMIENNNKLKFTVSLGVSEINTADNDIESLIKRADDALYVAKENGRNKVCS